VGTEIIIIPTLLTFRGRVGGSKIYKINAKIIPQTRHSTIIPPENNTWAKSLMMLIIIYLL
jgi:hypothetical protein